MSRPRRYLLILGILLLAGMVALTWQLMQKRFPNAFDRETEDAAEVEKLKAADLTRPAAASTVDWPQFLGPNRDGTAVFDTAGWDDAVLTKRWESPCGGGYSSCVVAGGRVYVQDKAAADERVLCLNAEDGQILWDHRTAAGYARGGQNYMAGPRATPTVFDGRLYTVGALGRFQCLTLPTTPGGKPAVLWEHDLLAEFRGESPTWGVACSPLVEGDLVVVQPGGKDGSVVAFDRVTGAKRWAAGKDPSGYSSPVATTLGGVRQVVAVTGKAVVGLRATDGTVLWEQPWETPHDGNVASPVVAGEYVFVSSNYGKGCALFHVTPAGEGKAVAKVVYFRRGRLMQNHHSTSVHSEGFLFGYDGSQLRGVDLRAGTEVEDWPTAGSIKSGKGSLILVGDRLFGQTERGDLFVTRADPKAGDKAVYSTDVLAGPECWATPAFAAGRVYLRDGSKVVCVELSAPKK